MGGGGVGEGEDGTEVVHFVVVGLGVLVLLVELALLGYV